MAEFIPDRGGHGINPTRTAILGHYQVPHIFIISCLDDIRQYAALSFHLLLAHQYASTCCVTC